MQNDIPNFNLLAVFAAVIEQGSLSKAAEQLNTNQSTVSTAMARLSKQLGQELYLRKGRGIEPTSYAKNLYKQVQEPISQLNQVFQSLGSFDPETAKRQFVITAPEHLQWVLMNRFAKTTPADITLEVFDQPSDESKMYDDLMSQKVDLLIDILPPKQASIRSTKLLENSFVVVCSQDHPRIQGTLTAELFMQEKHALLERKRNSLYSLTHYTSIDLSKRNVAYHGRTLFSNLMLCSQTDCLSVVPLSLALQFKDRLQLQVFTPPFEHTAMSTYLIWPKRLDNDPAHIWLRDTIFSISKKIQVYLDRYNLEHD
ncbi:LysR family transcriptional regulator [Vibrio breoganii]|uniref:LysR family transcriptional regulator n=2 Tax=Vibrio breoganii TaxID=553239 RepID=UPI000C819506|nr:LysR family transcriptional regulator [Vibrio breoganii]PMO63434.1 LysR family transcriptional regulator [Vibrio breoganii]